MKAQVKALYFYKKCINTSIDLDDVLLTFPFAGTNQIRFKGSFSVLII